MPKNNKIEDKIEEFDKILNSSEDTNSEIEKRIGALEIHVATLEERSTQNNRIIYFILSALGLGGAATKFLS